MFLDIHRYPKLPWDTRYSICQDVAEGLSALHSCGVVHGDVKTENVLMKKDARLIAKVADFSHSKLDTGEAGRLPGGTSPFNAPEWKETLPIAALYKTDVFSYGLLMSNILVGMDIFTHFRKFMVQGWDRKACIEAFEQMKKNESLREYITDVLHEQDTDFRVGETRITQLRGLLRLTLQLDPQTRDLEAVKRYFALE